MNRLLNCDKYLWDYPLNYGSKLLPIQSCTVQLVKIVSYRWMCLNFLSITVWWEIWQGL